MSYKPRMRNGDLRLLLAMREPYLSKLLDGSKTIEVRRTRPAPEILRNAKSIRLYLYKGGHIHGYVDVCNMAYLEEVELYANWQDICSAACLTEQEAHQYLAGANRERVIFYEVHNPVKYTQPLKTHHRPQSWVYIIEPINDKDLIEQ